MLLARPEALLRLLRSFGERALGFLFAGLQGFIHHTHTHFLTHIYIYMYVYGFYGGGGAAKNCFYRTSGLDEAMGAAARPRDLRYFGGLFGFLRP